jgi:predicted ATPase
VALWQAAALHQHRREGQAAQERAEAAIRLSTERGFPHWVAYGTSLRGWALAEQGQEEEGIAQVRWGMAAWQDTGAEIGRTYYIALLAEAYGKAGQAEKGLAALADAAAMVDKTRDRRWEAELYRPKGELLLAQESKSQRAEIETDSQGEAETCFLKAIEIAQKQQAKSWELRATMSLARLLASQGRRDEARTMLAEIYGWFTEGLDTADLKDAKALLDELEGTRT